MISDTTLETVLNLWKKEKITLDEARKLLGIEQGIKWRQTGDFVPSVFVPWISTDVNHPGYEITHT